MAISKRTRFEVLRRDGYACRYCGGRAPDVTLTVDHIVPTALGGADDPSNLTAACADCNSGKASSSPDEQLVADVDADTLRWAAAMRQAAAEETTDHHAHQRHLDALLEVWETSVPSYARTRPRYRLPLGWESTCLGLLAVGLTEEQLLRAAEIALGSPADNAFRYMVGVANNMLADLHSRASRLLDEDGV